MNPETRIATNQRTHEIAYVAALVPHNDGKGHNVFQYEPIPEWVSKAHPGIKPFMPRKGHPMFAFDAGHGVTKDMKNGSRAVDFGCMSSDQVYQEANITLAYAKTAAQKMNALGGDVIISRTDPVYFHKGHPEKDHAPYTGQGFAFRWAAANNAFAGYVSFHVNHAENGDAQGTRLYGNKYATGLSQSSQLLNVLRQNLQHVPYAQAQQLKKLDPAYEPPAGWDYVQDAKFAPRIQELIMISGKQIPRTPSVLLEVGFISNPTDAANVNSSDHRNKVTGELVNDLWNFNEIRAAMLGSKGVQSALKATPGMSDVAREINGGGRITNSNILFVEPPNAPSTASKPADKSTAAPTAKR
ncbi:MAG: N-acetylmuramoyl-L-alanine amidase [Rickettsiales bacterium]